MNSALSRWLAVLFLAVACIAAIVGCSRDPNGRKQKYLDSANHYFERQEYREAAIQFQNAIRIDPRYADAHYGLGQCYMKMGSWQQAYRESQRTLELRRGDSAAALSIGTMLLASGRVNEAKE